MACRKLKLACILLSVLTINTDDRIIYSEKQRVMTIRNVLKICAVTFMLGTLSGCSSLFSKHVEWETVEPESYPTIRAVGYAPIDAQMGSDDTTRTLMAIKASKLEAYRELAEQVYGQRVDGDQSLQSLVVTNTQLKASVEGVIRGARVTKSYAVGENTYATELELNFEEVYDIYLSTARPKRIKDVRYY